MATTFIPTEDTYELGKGTKQQLTNPPSQNPYPDETWNYDNYYNYWLEYFKGTPYESAFLANPHHGSDYQPSVWDSWSEAFLGTSDARKYALQREQDSRDYIAQLVQSEREEKYNSAQENVAREQDAGLNPDLLQNVSGGSATEFDNQKESSPVPDQGSKFGNVLKYSIDTLLKSFDLASSLTEKVFSMKSMQKQIDNQEISNLDAMIGVADKITESVNRGDYNPDVKFNIDNGHISWYDDASKDLDLPSYLKYIPMSKRNSVRFFPLLGQRYHSFENRKKSGLTKKDLNEVLREIGMQEASSYYSGIDDMPEVWKSTLSSISSLVDDEFKSRLQSLDKENQFNRDYFSGLSAEDLYKAENAAAQGKKQNEDMLKNMYSKQAELINNLVKSSRNGGLEGFFSNMVLFAMPFFNNLSGVSSGSFKGKNGSGRNFSVKFK